MQTLWNLNVQLSNRPEFINPCYWVWNFSVEGAWISFGGLAIFCKCTNRFKVSRAASLVLSHPCCINPTQQTWICASLPSAISIWFGQYVFENNIFVEVKDGNGSWRCLKTKLMSWTNKKCCKSICAAQKSWQVKNLFMIGRPVITIDLQMRRKYSRICRH